MSFFPPHHVGTYVGTEAAQSITAPGFSPSYVRIVNDTDRDIVIEHFRGQADGSAIKTDTEVAEIATDGITLTDRGFDLGADADVNELGKTYYYIVMR